MPIWQRMTTSLGVVDSIGIYARADSIRTLLGPFAGLPEVASSYFQPIDSTLPDSADVMIYWRGIARELLASNYWVRNPSRDPYQMPTGLRAVGRPIIALLEAAKTFPEDAVIYYAEADKAGRYLAALQMPNGLWPFPDLRDRHPRLGRIAERFLSRNPDLLVDGWIIDDAGQGDFFYDQGICGVAITRLAAATDDPLWDSIAAQAIAWTTSRPLSSNWNYNAFAAWQVAEQIDATGDTTLLPELFRFVHYGILPGQMENGRWFDPHNARLVYEAILGRGLLAAWRVWPESDYRRSLADRLRLTLDDLADRIIRKGASSNSTTTQLLADASRLLPNPSPRWVAALNVNVNAAVHLIDDIRAPHIGLYLAEYLRFRFGAS